MTRFRRRSTDDALPGPSDFLQLSSDEPAPPKLSNGGRFTRQMANRLERWSETDRSLEELHPKVREQHAVNWAQYHWPALLSDGAVDQAPALSGNQRRRGRSGLLEWSTQADDTVDGGQLTRDRSA